MLRRMAEWKTPYAFSLSDDQMPEKPHKEPAVSDAPFFLLPPGCIFRLRKEEVHGLQTAHGSGDGVR